MVVVSGSWIKNAPTYPSPTSALAINNNVGDGGVVLVDGPTTDENNTMAAGNTSAKAILTCRPNSHNFQERTLILDQPIKVGRSVARAKPTSTNAIFDCKVLSRNHALLWYENGKFYLQDTKSSNGTFVNNHKLTSETENHELSSGDIVQFGVDVVENNRKVTHGCIIATIRLYLPDGKEAKASPSITNGDRHGMVPLDDLYRLSQIIQEANQREQCLETKLTALQQVVDETRKSAEESWQAFVGEERLLSRVSALENQLTQANKNWTEDRLREELAKIQQESEAYQIAAKEALQKLHDEKLEAVALAMEQERARISAEQEALLAKEQCIHAQVELETIALKLTQHLTDAEEQRMRVKQREQELEANLESESGKLLDLQLKLHELKSITIQDFICLRQLGGAHTDEKLIYRDDIECKCKEDLIAENDVTESILMSNKSNGIDKHINLMVGPVCDSDDASSNMSEKSDEETSANDATNNKDNDENKNTEMNVTDFCERGSCDERKRVYFCLQEEENDKDEDDCESQDGSETVLEDDNYMMVILGNEKHREKQQKNETNNDIIDNADTADDNDNDTEDKIIDYVDSKTLKYQYQSAQNELKKKIEQLESRTASNKLKIQELDHALNEEQALSEKRLEESTQLKEELILMQQKYKEISNENQQYKDRIDMLKTEIELMQEDRKSNDEKCENGNEKSITEKTNTTGQLITYDQLVNLEEELVMIKERYAQVNIEKSMLQRDLIKLTEQYNMACNRSHNRYFLYIAPLVMMVVYLLISAMIS